MPESPDEPPPGVPRPDPDLSWWDRLTDVARALGLSRAWLIGGILAVVSVGVIAVGLRRPDRPPELSLPRADTTPVTAASAPATTAAVEVVAHAAGAVVRPGVYRLPADARVADLLAAAGGPTADADVDRVNLAAPLTDGEQVYVPRRGEVPPPTVGAGASSGGADPAEPLDLNAATASELETLPGIGPTIAQAIVDYRDHHGPFASVDELLEVPGIGDAKLAQIRSMVRV